MMGGRHYPDASASPRPVSVALTTPSTAAGFNEPFPVAHNPGSGTERATFPTDVDAISDQTRRNRRIGGRRAAEAVKRKRLSAQQRLEGAMAGARALQGSEAHKVRSLGEILARLRKD